MMQFQEILEKKRDNQPLSKEEIQFFVTAYTENQIPDYLASAMLMAIYINGLSTDETVNLTEAMLYSGTVVNLDTVPGIKVDKHSTGGVGDKTSLIIAPICAALGIPVPMISGRGLGHTGGTLDKLESIPGFNVNLPLSDYQKIIQKTGLCLIGQTKEIAPADKKLYALRDVTCTVANKSLISASIMSKKLAEGIDALVLDVKTGRGAFMQTEKASEELASLLISIGKKMDKAITALITDMSQPLGSHVGNALEVIESIQILKGECQPEQKDLLDLSIALSAHMIMLGGKATNYEEACSLAENTIKDLSAFNKFKEITTVQGGDSSALDDFTKLPTAKEVFLVKASKSGFIHELDALSIGKGSVLLGAGRKTIDSIIDPAVGLVLKRKIGAMVEQGDTLMEVHFNNPQKLQDSRAYFESAITIQADEIVAPSIIKKVIN